MLSNNDLKQIGKLIDDRLQKRFLEQDKRIDERFKREFTPIRRDIRSIKSDMKTIVHFFDTEITDLKKRASRIESHLRLPSLA